MGLGGTGMEWRGGWEKTGPYWAHWCHWAGREVMLVVVTFLTNTVVEELLQELHRVHRALVSTPKSGGTAKPTQDCQNTMVRPQNLSRTPKAPGRTPKLPAGPQSPCGDPKLPQWDPQTLAGPQKLLGGTQNPPRPPKALDGILKAPKNHPKTLWWDPQNPPGS